VLLARLLGLLMGAEMSEVEPPPLALPIECYQIRTGTPAASDVTDRGVGVVRDGVLRATLIDQNHVNVVLADVPPLERLADWRIRHNQTAFVIFVDGADEDDSLDALYAGARAILPRTAKPDEIITAIKAVTNGLAVLPSELLPALLSGASLVGELLDDKDPDRVRLTPRELEVLAAMADGVSNKAIAARLGISFHTAKFHVAAILAKLNADSRTEAVARAAQLGLVML
jgi:DNA-binding NarL/FixJ family response regulator